MVVSWVSVVEIGGVDVEERNELAEAGACREKPKLTCNLLDPQMRNLTQRASVYITRIPRNPEMQPTRDAD